MIRNLPILQHLCNAMNGGPLAALVFGKAVATLLSRKAPKISALIADDNQAWHLATLFAIGADFHLPRPVGRTPG